MGHWVYFLCVVSGFVIDLGAATVLVQQGASNEWGATAGFCLGMVANFTLQALLIGEVSGAKQWMSSFYRYCVANLVSLVLRIGLVSLLGSMFQQLDGRIIVVSAAGMTLIINFLTSKYYVFVGRL